MAYSRLVSAVTAFSGARGRLSLVAVLVLLAVVVAGCATSGKGVREYSEQLDAWTRSTKIYDGIDVRLTMNATFRNRDFRAAYVRRYVEAYRLEEGSKEAMDTREAEESELYNEFFVSVSAPDSSLNDLDSKRSVWKLYLEDGAGAVLSPVSVKRISTSSALISTLFPYMDTWSVGYIVRFPRYSASGTEPVPNEKSKYLKLRIAGLLGSGSLVWKLDSDK
ncbi:MAG: hypothetical protein IME99_05455 [Proteobacteria bacterium]|nr:hypothetical protein [Pseudomonadota bacterium]